MKLKMIVAFSKNYGIGYLNKIPWKLSGDMKYFKKITIGNGNNAVVMGRKTYDSLRLNKKNNNKILPKRSNIILSKNNCTGHAAIISGNRTLAVFLTDKESIYDWYKMNKLDDIWIIGGASVYNQFITHTALQEIYVTEVDEEYKTDTYFPLIPNNFSISYKSKIFEEDGIKYCHKIYRRISNINDKNKLHISFPKYSADYV